MNIHGAKKGGGKQRQPVIAPDSAQSKAFISIMYGLGEGEIAGLANGYQSVYLEDTPLQNDNGEFNFPNVKVDFRTGTNDQEYIEGFPDVASETAVNVELKHGTPFVKAFNNLDLDALRVRLKWGALRSQDRENGDVSGVKIDYAIDVKTDNGGWVEAINTSINAKTSDAYERSHRIDLPKSGAGWQLRVRRITPNSTSEFISDKMYIAAISEVIDLKLRYPNTALLGLRYDAESFRNVAKMSARCRGLIIKVPTNYDPVARTYTGMWDGQFKMAYSNNPAWVYYDLCTAERYGLGSRLTQSMIDKWSLYRLAQYCDEMVDDGMGGQEPRFTVNVYIQSADGAFELLSRLAGVFRAISYWDGNSIVLDADIPQDSIYSFSRANVIDGVFEYTGTRSRDRRTVAKVAWDNPANHFKTEYEYVRDEAAIAKFGVRVADIAAWGCTSRGQAQRAGLWALKSEQLETRMVTFKVGLDGLIPAPAKVIEISDELFAGRATGGRVLAINKTKTVITLDRAITAKAGDTLVINGDDGVSQRRQIRSVSGDKITVTKAFGNISVENVWVLDSQDLATMKFRVLSVTADDNHTFTITAVQYNPAKYDAIDHGAYIDERPISVINPTVQAPTKSVNLSSYHTVNQGVSITTLVIGWEQVAGAVKYTVEWRKDNGNWQTLPPTGTNSIEITGVYAGQYEARVTAISAFGQASLATHSNLTEIQGKIGKPTKLAKLTVQGLLFGMELSWVFGANSADTNYTEIQVSPDGRTNITALGTFAYPTNKHEITGLQGNLTQFYRGRIVDKLGNVSDWTAWVRGTTEARADKVLDILSGQINQSHLDQSLRTPIAKIGGIETDLNGVKTQIPSLQSTISTITGQLPTLNTEIANAKRELQTAQSTLNTAVANITTERNRINTAIRDITALQSANNAKTQELANLTQTVNGHTSQVRELAVTTGDLSQKYSQLKTATDTANSEIATIKQTQNGQATSIERLGAKFDSLAVGGRNLLLNTQALNPLWTLPTSIDNGVATFVGTGRLLSSTQQSDNIQALENGKVTISFTAKSNQNGRLHIRLRRFNTNNQLSDIAQYITIDSREFKRYSLTLDYEKWTNQDRVNFEIATYEQAGFVCEVKLPKLEIGTIATDWTPAPEDLQADIDSKATTANLQNLRQALTDADTALSRQITAMDTAYKSTDRQLTANLASETTARTSADTALGQRIDTLTADYNGNKASVANQLKTLSDKDTATASQISSLTANITTAKQTADAAKGKVDNAQNTANNALNRANTANSAITSEQRARADADNSLASRITALDTAYKSADNNLTSRLAREETARANGDNANAQALRTLESTVQGVSGRVGTSEGKIANLERTTSDTNQALATAQSQLNARFDNLAVGGRNYLLNSDFVITKHDGGNLRSQSLAMSNAIKTIATPCTLTVSAHFKLQNVSELANDVRMLFLVRFTHADGKVTAKILSYNAKTRTDIDKRLSARVEITKPITGFAHTYIDVYGISAEMASIARPKIELGNIATDWTPAPEDVDAQFVQTNANISTLQQAVANADSALSQRISALDASYKRADSTINASLTAEQKARADGDTALSQRITALDSAYQSADSALSARVATAEQSITTANQAIAQTQQTLTAKIDGLSVGGRNLITNSQVDNIVDGTRRYRLYRLTSDVNEPLVFTAKIKDIVGNNDNKLTVAITHNSNINGNLEQRQDVSIVNDMIVAKFNQPSKPINAVLVYANSGGYGGSATGSVTYYQVKAERGNIATDWTPAPEDVNVDLSPYATNANLDEFKQAQATKDTATASKLSQLESTLGTKASTNALDSLTTKVNQVDGKLTAEAQKISTLQTTVNGQSASIQQHAQTLNGLSAQWTLKVQSGNIVSGIGLASNNGVSDFAVRADKFYIASPTGQKGDTPFTVLTSPQVVNGVRIPAGTYINSAFITNASITMAKIADSIQSDNYVAGRQGWRLFKDGRFELNNTFGDGSSLELNSRGLIVWYDKSQGKKAVELGIFT
ncbi:TipJ family phage tail tip protein [Moraxella bovoculi]|uniref:TipJ family phage tail tip protein n=1 Tax=Moraxella bovoculi TaxID=386891 RepID=UPI0009B944FF|nr:phage tail protein [Moraxella bovoculi]